jgi:hypothetical protein
MKQYFVKLSSFQELLHDVSATYYPNVLSSFGPVINPSSDIDISEVTFPMKILSACI